MNIFDYQNYRLYLSDIIEEKKRNEKGFSQRAILSKMGITSTGFLSNILSGKNNLTITQTIDLTKILSLSKKETDYFEAMVMFTQSKTIAEKNRFFDKMIFIHKSKYKSLSKNQMSLFAKWHYAVVHEIIALKDFSGDYKTLAKSVLPRISVAEAKDAIQKLEKIGLIFKDKNGIYHQKDSTVTTGDEVKSLFVSNFLISTMHNAEKSLDMTNASNRDISALTLKISEDKIKIVKLEIKMFRKKILALVADDNKQNRIYQCNINFFPVSEEV